MRKKTLRRNPPQKKTDIPKSKEVKKEERKGQKRKKTLRRKLGNKYSLAATTTQ